jgi:hypothetical protein
MNWNEYEAAWKSQELPAGADPAALRATFEAKSRRLHGTLLVRDLTEAGAGLAVIAANALFWWKIRAAGWPMVFAIALILGVSLFFVRERLRARRLRLGAEAPLLAKVEADITELRHQRRLLRTLWAWYLGPCACAVAIQAGVAIRHAPSWDPLRSSMILLTFSAFFALVFWLAWAINRRALRRRIEPRLLELEKLRRELLADE